MFRNREIRRFFVAFMIIAAVMAAAGFVIHPAAGVMALIAAAAFGAVFFIFTRARYQRIAEIAEQIDLVLH